MMMNYDEVDDTFYNEDGDEEENFCNHVAIDKGYDDGVDDLSQSSNHSIKNRLKHLSNASLRTHHKVIVSTNIKVAQAQDHQTE